MIYYDHVASMQLSVQRRFTTLAQQRQRLIFISHPTPNILTFNSSLLSLEKTLDCSMSSGGEWRKESRMQGMQEIIVLEIRCLILCLNIPVQFSNWRINSFASAKKLRRRARDFGHRRNKTGVRWLEEVWNPHRARGVWSSINNLYNSVETDASRCYLHIPANLS